MKASVLQPLFDQAHQIRTHVREKRQRIHMPDAAHQDDTLHASKGYSRIVVSHVRTDIPGANNYLILGHLVPVGTAVLVPQPEALVFVAEKVPDEVWLVSRRH